MVRQQARSVGVDLLGTERTHSFPESTVAAPPRLENALTESVFETGQQLLLSQLIDLHDHPTRSPAAGYKQTKSMVRNCSCDIDNEMICTIPIPRTALDGGPIFVIQRS